MTAFTVTTADRPYRPPGWAWRVTAPVGATPCPECVAEGGPAWESAGRPAAEVRGRVRP